MRLVPLDLVREGMICAKQIFGRNGEFLLNKGSVILESYIEKIKEQGISAIYIDDDISKNIEITELISNELRHKTIKTLKDMFITLEKSLTISEYNIEMLGDLTRNIVEDILDNKDVIVNMVDLKVFDDYTFYHSVNVAVLSLVVGTALKLDKEKLYILGLTAILHDIGKVFIPREILNKPGRLLEDEFEIMKTHSIKGYQYLRENSQIPAATYVGISHHHEKYDGTGYPFGLKGDKISLIGRIVAIADVYDALTSDRPYRKAMPPSEALEYIMGAGGTLFDPYVVEHFVGKIAPYPVGTCVLLSDDRVGLVVQNYTDCPIRPKLKIIRHNNTSVEPYYIDLRNDMHYIGVTIVDIATDI